MPLISIIVPIYNSEKTLNRCVDSILQQTFTDWELLLIDDGSKDSSGDICDEYARKDPRIKVFHKENGGVSSARNIGLDNAKGEWIAFVDSDDWIESDYLYYLINIGDYDCILGSLSCHKGRFVSNIVIGDIFCNQNEDVANALFSLNNHLGLFVPWGKLLKNKIILNHKLRFNENIDSGEDSLFIYHYLFYINSIYASKKILYHYNIGGGLSQKKLSLQKIDLVIKQTLNALEKLELKLNYNTEKKKFDTILYFVTRYNIKNHNLKSMYQDISYLSRQTYIQDLISDNIFIPKGIRRRIFDFLFKRRWIQLLVLLSLFTKRFYY